MRFLLIYSWLILSVVAKIGGGGSTRGGSSTVGQPSKSSFRPTTPFRSSSLSYSYNGFVYTYIVLINTHTFMQNINTLTYFTDGDISCNLSSPNRSTLFSLPRNSSFNATYLCSDSTKHDHSLLLYLVAVVLVSWSSNV